MPEASFLICAGASKLLCSREGFESRSYARVLRSKGERSEAGSREISVRKFTCDQIPPGAQKNRLQADFD